MISRGRCDNEIAIAVLSVKCEGDVVRQISICMSLKHKVQVTAGVEVVAESEAREKKAIDS